VHTGAAFAAAVRRLATEVDAMLGWPARFDLVDLGAGRGELLHALATEPLPARWSLTGVEVVDRPVDVAVQIGWSAELPARVTGLIVANEWLDTIPLDIAVLTADGPRLVCVDDRGAEILGPAPAADQQQWIDRWWPLTAVGDRAEIGLTRDRAWARAVGVLDRGVAVTADYAHVRYQRPSAGTVAGYRVGRLVAPLLDGSCDVTAHVALDACAEAGRSAGATESAMLTQHDALRRLGVSARRRPRAAADSPAAYLAALARTGSAAELLDPGGLGGFHWLAQSRGVPLPPSLRTRA
jgi:SAM-dependent MidA family methyltransferase